MSKCIFLRKSFSNYTCVVTDVYVCVGLAVWQLMFNQTKPHSTLSLHVSGRTTVVLPPTALSESDMTDGPEVWQVVVVVGVLLLVFGFLLTFGIKLCRRFYGQYACYL